jgi:NTP pyrophosphatase (non-canonical NTP hydrolase)
MSAAAIPASRFTEFLMTKTFAQRIAAMNAMYQLPAHDRPTLPADVPDRLAKFKATVMDEVHEIDEIVKAAREGAAPIDIAVAIADLLGDIIVYCRSEALKYGLPLEDVLEIIMDSNESKLGADGRPIYDANGKFLKGPHYWKPEPRIRALLERPGPVARTG